MERKAALVICSVMYVVASSCVKDKNMEGLSSAFRLNRLQSALSSFQRGVRFIRLGTETRLSRMIGKWSLPKGLSKTFHVNEENTEGDEMERSIDVNEL